MREKAMMSSPSFAGRSVIVTGAGSGIGRATALMFASAGAYVLAADTDSVSVHETAYTAGERTKAHVMDVSKEDDWISTTAQAVSHGGKLDILCNIAGIGRGGSIENLDLTDWNAMLDVNLTGVMLGCKHGLRAILSSGGHGAIINMSSVGGLAGISDIAGYCATKGGVTILSKSVALYCAERGYPVRCVAIHPTYVDTEMLDPVSAAAGIPRDELTSMMANRVPLKRVATPDDVAYSVLFAASDQAAMLTGSSLIVDGGQLAGPSPVHFQ